MSTYRPNVAAILRKPKSGKILVCQRKDYPKSWHFPQGGVNKGEDLIAALYREVKEEIGIPRNRYTITSCRTGYRYKFPNGHLKKGQFCGQDQTFFLCDFHGKKKEIFFDGHVQEFKEAAWIHPSEFQLNWVPKFKRKVIKRVLRDFFGIKFHEDEVEIEITQTNEEIEREIQEDIHENPFENREDEEPFGI